MVETKPCGGLKTLTNYVCSSLTKHSNCKSQVLSSQEQGRKGRCGGGILR